MISIDDLSEILNAEFDEEFLTAALELLNDGENPIDPEHPNMEETLERIVDKINDTMEMLPLGDDYE